MKKELEDSDAKLEEQEKKIRTNKTRLDEALEKIAKEKEAKKLSEKEYEEKKGIFERAKERAQKMEGDVSTERRWIKEALDKVNNP
jgi:hypothetical protein